MLPGYQPVFSSEAVAWESLNPGSLHRRRPPTGGHVSARDNSTCQASCGTRVFAPLDLGLCVNAMVFRTPANTRGAETAIKPHHDAEGESEVHCLSPRHCSRPRYLFAATRWNFFFAAAMCFDSRGTQDPGDSRSQLISAARQISNIAVCPVTQRLLRRSTQSERVVVDGPAQERTSMITLTVPTYLVVLGFDIIPNTL